MRDVAEIERALETFGQSANGGLTGSALANNPSRLNYWAWALHKLPAVYYERLFVAAGGLMTLGGHWPTAQLFVSEHSCPLRVLT